MLRFRGRKTSLPSSTEIKIYSAHHSRPLFHASHGVFVPIWGGGEQSLNRLYEIDEQIPRKPTLGYNETALHYYVWKHRLAGIDYVGFEHYRRMFLFPCLFEGVDDLSIPPVPAGWWHGYADETLYAKMLDVRTTSSSRRV